MLRLALSLIVTLLFLIALLSFILPEAWGSQLGFSLHLVLLGGIVWTLIGCLGMGKPSGSSDKRRGRPTGSQW